jgi:hypothetical protein
MKLNQAALDIAQLAKDMADGYSTHSAALTAVTRLDAETLRRVTWWRDPVGTAQTKDGNPVCFNLYDFLMLAPKRSRIAAKLPRVWLTGALLAVGDALDRHDYFDRGPELKLVRHLRNGIAHGNPFEIRDPEKLDKYPAHNRDVWPRRPYRKTFEITPALDGTPVLFDFMEAGDVIEALCDVSLYLGRLSRGKPPPRQPKP